MPCHVDSERSSRRSNEHSRRRKIDLDAAEATVTLDYRYVAAFQVYKVSLSIIPLFLEVGYMLLHGMLVAVPRQII